MLQESVTAAVLKAVLCVEQLDGKDTIEWIVGSDCEPIFIQVSGILVNTSHIVLSALFLEMCSSCLFTR